MDTKGKIMDNETNAVFGYFQHYACLPYRIESVYDFLYELNVRKKVHVPRQIGNHIFSNGESARQDKMWTKYMLCDESRIKIFKDDLPHIFTDPNDYRHLKDWIVLLEKDWTRNRFLNNLLCFHKNDIGMVALNCLHRMGNKNRHDYYTSIVPAWIDIIYEGCVHSKSIQSGLLLSRMLELRECYEQYPSIDEEIITSTVDQMTEIIAKEVYQEIENQDQVVIKQNQLNVKS